MAPAKCASPHGQDSSKLPARAWSICTLPCPHRSIWVFLRRGRRDKNKRFNT